MDLERRSEIDSDLALYNKLGDLYLKAGKISSAVETYEKAVNRYSDSGFPNNAIALCNKVLRNAPGRTPMYLKLAKLMLERGFTSEAKRNLLEYAERMQRAGRLEEAFNALKEFADLSPDNEEIRLLLAEQLKAAARTDEAREQLSKLFAEVEAHGDRRAIRATLDKMRAIDPDYDVEAAPKPQVERRKKASDLIFLDLGDEPAEPPRPIFEPPPPEPEPQPEPALPLIDVTEPDVAPEPALEATSLAEEAAEEPTPVEPLEIETTAIAESETADVERISTHFAPPEDAVKAVDGLSVEREFEAPAERDVPALEIEPTALEEPAAAPPAEEPPAEPGALAEEPAAEAVEARVEPEVAPEPEAEAVPVSEPASWGIPEEPAEDLKAALEEAVEAVEAVEEPAEAAVEDVEAAATPEAEPAAAAEVLEVGPAEIEAEPVAEEAIPEPVEAPREEPVPEGPALVAEAEAVEEAEPETASVEEAEEESVEELVVELEQPVSFEPVEAGEGADLGIEVDGSIWDDTEVGALEVPEIDVSGLEDELTGLETIGEEAPAAVPSLELVEEEVPQPPADVDELESRVAADPENADLHRALAEALIEQGERDRGLEELEITLRLHEEEESWGAADGVVREILRLEPNSVRHHQKRVELAFHQGDKSDLAEAYLGLADALLREGATDRARAVYQRVLEHDPLNERAQLGLATLEPEPEPEEAATLESAPQPSPLDGEFVDLGALILDDEDLRERDTRMRIEEEEPTGDEQRDFEEMLSEFKRGIEANLADEDWQAHYDLGVAFKEMGLIDEAITEFQKALRSPEGRLRTAEALGGCFYERGQYAVAATVLRRAVEADTAGDEEKIGLLYWLGRCEEQLGRHADALAHYQRVFSVDIGFQDVSQRVTDLAEAGS